jgi:hypothetical protein
MTKILTIAAAALALWSLTGAARAQSAFENAYTQPAQMVDDIAIGARIGDQPRFGRAVVTVVVAPPCRTAACERRPGV